MITIRQAQIDEFEEKRKRRFIEEVALEVRTHHPDECAELSDEELRDQVAEGFDRASNYGFRQKYSLSMFVQLQFLAAPNFDEYPTVRHLLTHTAIEPDNKIDRIIESMRDSDWDDIRRRAGRVHQ